MRHAKWVPVVLLAVFIGCSDSSKEIRKASDTLDEARRLYAQATGSLSAAPYTDESGKPITITETKLPKVSVPTTMQAEDPAALALLDKALAKVNEVAGGAGAIPPSVKSDAFLLKGQIQLARGRYFAAAAIRYIDLGRPDRLAVRVTAADVIGSADVVDFAKQIAGGTLDKVTQLQTQAAAEQKALEDAVKAKDTQIDGLRKANDKLVGENQTLQKDLDDKRSKSQSTGGMAGVDLLKQAQDIQKQIDAKSAEIAANQSKIAALDADKALMQPAIDAAKAKIALAKGRIDATTSQKAAVGEEGSKQAAKAVEFYAQLKAPVAKVSEACKNAADQEKSAMTALGEAVSALTQAYSDAQQETGQAKEVADQHLATLMALRSDANLWMGKVDSRRISFSDEMVVLSKLLTDAAAKAGQSGETFSQGLAPCIADTAKLKQEAVRYFEEAATDLEKITGTYFKSGSGKNIQWIYQGMLADAYLGKFMLTRSDEVRDKAKKLLEDALAGKEYSPYLATLAQLQQALGQVPASQSSSSPAP